MRPARAPRACAVVLSAAIAMGLGACQPMPEGAGTGALPTVALPGAFGSAPLIDLAGQEWQPRVDRGYVSAIGSRCAAVTLSPVGGGPRVHRSACLEDGAWQIMVPLALGLGEPDPRFPPLSDPTVPPAPPAAPPPAFKLRSSS